MRGYIGLVAAAALCAVPIAAATAATSTATMTDSITVTGGCTIAVTDINFGSVQSTVLSSALTSTAAQGGLVSYTCASQAQLPVLSAGNGANHTTTNRMKGTLGGFIGYSLNVPTVLAFSGVLQTAQVTATIPAQGVLPALDTYTDAVVMTLTY